MKLFGKSLLSQYTAPLTVPLVFVFCLVPPVIAVAWASLAVPYLCAAISPMEDSHPIAHAFLHTLFAFMVLPAFAVPQFLMVHFYQKYYDRKKRERNAG